jgi:hypothetical protein
LLNYRYFGSVTRVIRWRLLNVMVMLLTNIKEKLLLPVHFDYILLCMFSCF